MQEHKLCILVLTDILIGIIETETVASGMLPRL